MRYDFEWDIRKAKSNILKHDISFERATIFRDPNPLSIPDEEHSETEERWLTMVIRRKRDSARNFTYIQRIQRKRLQDKNYFGAKSDQSGRRTI